MGINVRSMGNILSPSTCWIARIGVACKGRGTIGGTGTVISAGGAGTDIAFVTADAEEEARADCCAPVGVAECSPELLVAV